VDYLEGYEEAGEVVPTIPGLAVYLACARSTVYEWAKLNPDFADTVERILAVQHKRLVAGGLRGHYSAAIAKLLLYNHGETEKQQIDHRSGDGSMTPRTLDDFYDEQPGPTADKPDADA
jgi:hypothetical protein